MSQKTRGATIRTRFDQHRPPDGQLMMLWGFECPQAHPIVDQYLLSVTSLKDGAFTKCPDEHVIEMPGATHELALFALSPEEPIDFHRSLFRQQQLKPLRPQLFTHQMRVASDAVMKIAGDCMMYLVDHGALRPFGCSWDWFFATERRHRRLPRANGSRAPDQDKVLVDHIVPLLANVDRI
ncbi:hypothetical protein [Sinorhizobium fredii]|uniref:hypothetical protein n=1 Tax=Rhizobium fredii TaxID=380 RepID=UPI001297C88A|nr:hypothetical protein [Sinorhizobium fredii]MQW93998.1 hypothetical protein [Sinorhizobium fredii]